MLFLYTTDLHLRAVPEDEYKFKLFPWLRKVGKKYRIDAYFILGDLTDRKDKHPSVLVNRIVDELQRLAKVAPVYILRGNHDCIDPNDPFFRFISGLKDVFFITSLIQTSEVGTIPSWFKPPSKHNYIFVPHDREGDVDWEDLDFENADFVLLHQTINGVLASNGRRLDGLSTKLFRRAKGLVLSGDIHVPQKVGKVIYIGSPYHIHFGDRFEPRVLLVTGKGRLKVLRFPAPRKHVLKIRSPKSLLSLDGVHEGDSIRVTLRIPRSSFVDWQVLKKQVVRNCKKIGVDLRGVEVEEHKRVRLDDDDLEVEIREEKPVVTFKRFCKSQKVPTDEKTIGLELLDHGT